MEDSDCLPLFIVITNNYQRFIILKEYQNKTKFFFKKE